MAQYQFIVLTRATDGGQAEFDQWYDDRHLPDVAAVPGVVQARRFRVVQQDTAGDSPTWYSVALYEMETDDPKAVIAEINARSGTEAMPISPTVDLGAVVQMLAVETGSAT
jgi:hypothetical protein